MAHDDSRRIAANVRMDPDKFAYLENLRTTGFGLAQTERNRSDVYNEIMGYGIQTLMLKKELGDAEFEKLWKIMHQMDMRKLNLDTIAKMAGVE